MFRSLIILSLLVSAQTLAETPKPLSLPSGECSASINEAIVAAMKVAMVDHTSEYGGAIYQDGDKFCYTTPVTQNSNTSVDFRISKPAGTKLVALYHTHPDRIGESEFSPSDLNLAKDMNLLSFIGFHKSQEIRVFDPNKEKFSLKENRKAIRSSGHLVAQL